MKLEPVIISIIMTILPLSVIRADEFRTPADMTGDDWELVNIAHGDYSACLQEKTVLYSSTSDDPRLISDRVLEECSAILVQLDTDMGERNINPHFTQRYIYNMKNREAQVMLRSLMVMIANRQQQAGADSEEKAAGLKSN